MKHVLVTGASRGIGKAIALRILRDTDARVVLMARSEKDLRAVAAKYPRRAFILVADVSDSSQCEKMVAAASRLMGGLDTVVQSAGMVRYGKVGQITTPDFEAQFRTNLLGPVLLAQAAAALMKKRKKGGAILNIASTLGLKPAPGTLAYAAVKAGLINATQTMALELAPHRIRVNALAPGVVDTDMVRRGRSRRELAALKKLHPVGRLGTPEEIASLAVWMLQAQWVTGATYVIDGGLLLA